MLVSNVPVSVVKYTRTNVNWTTMPFRWVTISQTT